MQINTVQPATTDHSISTVSPYGNQVSTVHSCMSLANQSIGTLHGLYQLYGNIKGLPKLTWVKKKKAKDYSYQSVLFQCGIMNPEHKKRIDDSYDRYLSNLKLHNEKLAHRESEKQLESTDTNAINENQILLSSAAEHCIKTTIGNEFAKRDVKFD